MRAQLLESSDYNYNRDWQRVESRDHGYKLVMHNSLNEVESYRIAVLCPCIDLGMYLNEMLVGVTKLHSWTWLLKLRKGNSNLGVSWDCALNDTMESLCV